MLRLCLCWLVFLLAGVAACAEPAADTFPAAHKAVLIAGDGSLAVFDNAVSGMSVRLRTQGGFDIQRLSAATPGLPSATLENILSAIGSMRPRGGQDCFVFATSHGAEGLGLALSLKDEFLAAEALDAALLKGCGAAPTAVVVSGCFSGIFARPPMTRANRIVLTAARPDRTSFGCHAGRVYTVYDQCLLAAFDAGGTWKHAYASVKACVGAAERLAHVTPSEPQAWFGPAVAGMALPVRARHS